MKMYDSNGKEIVPIDEYIPNFLKEKVKLKKLKDKLEECIDIEDYESAAMIRDEIIALKATVNK